MRCGSCFRFREDTRDARAKGLEPQGNPLLRYDIARKPRQGVKCVCMAMTVRDSVTAQSKACRHWEHRAVWNAGTIWWYIAAKVKEWWRIHIRVPLGGLRKPLPLKWVTSYNLQTDTCEPAGEPECPHCGEMPYSTERCVFCGQRFTQEDILPKK